MESLPNQLVVFYFADGRTAEFVARNISEALTWARQQGDILSWNNQVATAPVSEPTWTR